MTSKLPASGSQDARHARVGLACAALVVAMVAMSYAAVPLYRLYCQATGFNGTTQRVAKPSLVTLDRTVSVRLDGNVGPGLKWDFGPVQPTIDVKIGENALVFFRATNHEDHAVTGTATFNVTPELAGGYFNKVQCFCFTEQRLEPGESIEMPVSFFVDPAITKDSDAQGVDLITLSYTFYRVPEKAAAATVAKKGS